MEPLHLTIHFGFPGRGVFSEICIPAQSVIDISPVLVLDAAQNKAHIEKTELYHYTYNWPSTTQPGSTTQAVVFGLGSMFNHSARHQNVGWTRDLERQVIVYRALRDIAAGEELCISYGGRLTFVDVEQDSSAVEIEDANDVLGRIEIDAK